MTEAHRGKAGTQPIVLFDGVCNLCASSVQFIIARDADEQFHFASLQSQFATDMLAPFDVDPTALDSVVLVEEGQVFFIWSFAILR